MPRREANNINIVVGTVSLTKFSYALMESQNARSVSELLFNFFAIEFEKNTGAQVKILLPNDIDLLAKGSVTFSGDTGRNDQCS